jgi:transposase
VSQQPSFEDVLAVVARLEARVVELEALVVEKDAVIVAQAARIVELEGRLGQDSGNSSVPPSQDPIHRLPPRSTRRSSGRSKGKQPGSDGRHLARVEGDHVRVVDHRPRSCSGCGAGLWDTAAGRVVVRQVVDLPVIEPVVTDHRVHEVACGCGTLTRADLPAGVPHAPVGYGPGVVALAVYLHVAQLVPVRRTADLLADVLGVEVSVGWVADVVARTARAVEPANERIRGLLNGSRRVGVDEACTKISGVRHWFWTAVTPTLTAFHADEHSRKRKALTAFGVLADKPDGHVVVHDAHPLYDHADHEHLDHALCCAHLVRDLAGIDEFDPTARKDGWAADLTLLLADAYRWRETWAAKGAVGLPEFKLRKITARWEELIERALAAHPHVGGPKASQSKARNIAVRLRDRREDYLRWTTDFTIPYSNNSSEQAIRMIKVRTKIGAFRQLSGLTTFLNLRGWLDTARKHGHHQLTLLRDAALGQIWAPAT